MGKLYLGEGACSSVREGSCHQGARRPQPPRSTHNAQSSAPVSTRIEINAPRPAHLRLGRAAAKYSTDPDRPASSTPSAPDELAERRVGAGVLLEASSCPFAPHTSSSRATDDDDAPPIDIFDSSECIRPTWTQPRPSMTYPKSHRGKGRERTEQWRPIESASCAASARTDEQQTTPKKEERGGGSRLTDWLTPGAYVRVLMYGNNGGAGWGGIFLVASRHSGSNAPRHDFCTIDPSRLADWVWVWSIEHGLGGGRVDLDMGCMGRDGLRFDAFVEGGSITRLVGGFLSSPHA